MSKDEALKLALSTLDEVRSETFRLLRNGQKLYAEEKVWNTINAIKEALAQPEQEPAATMRQILEIIAVGDSESPMQDACDTLIATGFWATDAKPFVSQPEQEPVAWGVFDGKNLHDMFFTEEEARDMARLKGDGSVVRPLCDAAHNIKENT